MKISLAQVRKKRNGIRHAVIAAFLSLLMPFASACALTEPRNCTSDRREITRDGFTVSYEHYQPKDGDALRSLIVMPPTDGITPLEKQYKWSFCRRGYSVYVIETWTGIDEVALELELHNRLLGRGQEAIHLVLKEIETPFVGLLGTSVGGIHGATALGRQPKINAAFLIAAGHPVGSVIARSELGDMKKLREDRIQNNGWSGVEDYERALLETIHVEPGRSAEAARTKDLGVIVVKDDVTVSEDLQWALARDLGADQIIEVSGDSIPGVSWLIGGGAHVAGIFRAWWFHEEDILDFFDRSAERSVAELEGE